MFPLKITKKEKEWQDLELVQEHHLEENLVQEHHLLEENLVQEHHLKENLVQEVLGQDPDNIFGISNNIVNKK